MLSGPYMGAERAQKRAACSWTVLALCAAVTRPAPLGSTPGRRLPPKAYLEEEASKKLRKYNRQNAPSKRGAISTWEGLVENQDKDQLRAMRKVLSRSARLVRN